MSLKDLVPWKRSEGWEDNPVLSLQREMNRMFENFWTEQPTWPKFEIGEFGKFFPKVEVTEQNNTVEVSAELPGMTQKDIEVTLSPDATMLTIKGEKKFEKEKKDKNYFRADRSYGVFRRVVALPSPVKAEGIEAMFKEGVLELKMPKAAAAETGAKKIHIKG
jgi:HSP20 family protein